ncbi:MAG TPA: CbiX/SirB N-terminal domain-containing protein [Terrimicrobiaceae bacterium]
MNSSLSDSALVLVGHGSTINPDSSAPIHAHARTIRERGIFGEVHSCFWKEEPSMREIYRMVESPIIYIVPVFISEGYFTQTVIPRELELEGPLTLRKGLTIHYCDPVGSHPRMTEALLRRAREVAADVPPQAASLFIVGHGTDLNDNSARAAKEQATRIRALSEYAEVISAYMEEPPLVADWHKLSKQPNVVIVPFFIADGLHSYQDIPILIGIAKEPGPAASQTEVFRRNPYLLHGKKLFYASAIGTEPMIAEVILDQVAASAAAFQ